MSILSSPTQRETSSPVPAPASSAALGPCGRSEARKSQTRAPG